MTIPFILSQITSLIAWIFFVLSYHAKRENKIILLQIISGLLYCASYILMGAMTGFLINLFETATAIAYYKTTKDKYIFLFTLPIYVAIGLISNDTGYLILIPIIASIVDSYGLIRNNKIMVLSGIISNILWIYYDFYYQEYVTVLGDLFLIISNLSIVIFGLYKYFTRKNIHMDIVDELSDDEINTIKKLDETCYDNIYRWTFDKLKELYLKEKNSYIIIKDRNKIVGYVNFLNITKDVYEKVLESNEIVDSFLESDIKQYNKNDILYINLNSIVLKREYNNKAIVRNIEDEINKFINNKLKHNYKIKEIFIYTVNEFEEGIVKDLGYDKIKQINEECILYKKTIKNIKYVKNALR